MLKIQLPVCGYGCDMDGSYKDNIPTTFMTTQTLLFGGGWAPFSSRALIPFTFLY
jgi:hypothetical protein